MAGISPQKERTQSKVILKRPLQRQLFPVSASLTPSIRVTREACVKLIEGCLRVEKYMSVTTPSTSANTDSGAEQVGGDQGGHVAELMAVPMAAAGRDSTAEATVGT